MTEAERQTTGLEIFAKVRALHDRTDSPGEKTAAMLKMQTLARKAGMSVEQAMFKLDTPDPTIVASATFENASDFRSAFSEFFNTPEFRAQRAEREAERRAKCEHLLKRYGSAEAVWADTDREAALRKACEPLTVWDPRPDWKGSYTLAGWGDIGGKATMPSAVRDAVTSGWPWPETVAAAWAEFEAAEELENARCAFEPAYTPHRWVEARRYVLEDVLDSHPARSLNDLRARMSWMEYLSSLQCQWTHDNDGARLATIRADIERMGARIRDEVSSVQFAHGDTDGAVSSPDPGSAPSPVQFAQRRTNASKRQDVMSLLHSGLTNREIARRVGVSPSTVGNIRRGL